MRRMPDDWIRQWGDPTLRAVAAPVAAFDELLAMQVRRMRATLLAADGAGLAATQVGSQRRVFVFRFTPDDPIDAIVNPEVVAASDARATFVEGCLSFMAVTVAVARPEAVRVRGFGLDGRERVVEAEGPDASLLQHEIDHLDGVLTLDRATPRERRRAIAVLLGEAAPAARAA
jgi:peptide deformylase